MVAQVSMAATLAGCSPDRIALPHFPVENAETYILQAICFYLPGWLWSHYEKGRVADIVGEKGKKKIDDILIEDEVNLDFFLVAQQLCIPISLFLFFFYVLSTYKLTNYK